MTQNLNQFAMTQTKGAVDLKAGNYNIISAAISASETGTLVPGQAVKIEDSAGGLPKVLALALATDSTFGFIARVLKQSEFEAKDVVEVALDGSIMVMEAGAAIARGAAVEVSLTGNKVITSAGVNNIVGVALDKAAADGDLIRVMIKITATNLAQIQAMIDASIAAI